MSTPNELARLLASADGYEWGKLAFEHRSRYTGTAVVVLNYIGLKIVGVESDELLFRTERHHDPNGEGYDEGWDSCLAAIRQRLDLT